MKKLALIVIILCVLVIITGADVQRKEVAPATQRREKPCYGYTIIEFGKGINCYGDTVRLVKVKGGQQLMVKEELFPGLAVK